MKKWHKTLAWGLITLLGSMAFTGEVEARQTTPEGLVTVSWGLRGGDDHCTQIWVDSARSEPVRVDVEVYNAAGNKLIHEFDLDVGAGEFGHRLDFCDPSEQHDRVVVEMRALGETEIGGMTLNPELAGQPYPVGFPPERVGGQPERPVRRISVPGPWQPPGGEKRWE